MLSLKKKKKWTKEKKFGLQNDGERSPVFHNSWCQSQLPCHPSQVVQGTGERLTSYTKILGHILTDEDDLPGCMKDISAPSLDYFWLENTQMPMRVILCREKHLGIFPK